MLLFFADAEKNCVFPGGIMTLSSLNYGMILGGFGLFMFGIKFMGDGLKSAAGDQLRDIINKYTSNRISALFIGILLTVIMQSSSATSAITIGLVRAGLMSLEQAAGVILGATIGTTVTSFLISVNIDKYAMFIVFIGAMFICFAKKIRVQYYGNVILGFGLIFFGMAAMGDALAALKDMPGFESLALSMSRNPILALLTGVLLTAAVQSSAATIGVIQKLYQAGAVSFGASLPFMFGANIGTTMTGILASIGGSLAGKRTAALHTLINIISTIFGMVLLIPYSNFIQMIAGNLNPMMQIAIANMIFKTITTLLFLPFIDKIVKLVKHILPGEEVANDITINELDIEIASTLPSAALTASQQASLKMVDLVRYAITGTEIYLDTKGTEMDIEKLQHTESMINRIDQQITDYLIRLSSNSNLSASNTEEIRFQFDAIKNYERVGDLASNLSEFYGMVFSKNESFTDAAIVEIKAMYETLLDMFDESVEVFVTKDVLRYNRLQRMENKLDEQEMKFRLSHFERMRNGYCQSPVAASVYSDVLGTLERMGDHCCNVAKVAVTGLTSDLSDDEIIASTTF